MKLKDRSNPKTHVRRPRGSDTESIIVDHPSRSPSVSTPATSVSENKAKCSDLEVWATGLSARVRDVLKPVGLMDALTRQGGEEERRHVAELERRFEEIAQRVQRDVAEVFLR